MARSNYPAAERAKRSGAEDRRLPELQAALVIGGLSVLSWAAVIVIAKELWAIL